MNPESLERKTYIPRDIKDQPNTQELAEVREIEVKLDTIPEFISVVAEGSIFKGYSVETSDVDLVLLYDSSGRRENSNEYWEQRKELSESAKNAKEEIWEQRKAKEQRPRNITFRLIDVNQNILENEFRHKRYDRLVHLFKLSTGNKIENYRSYWFERINDLPKEERKEIIDRLLEILSSKDFDWETLSKRVPDVEKEKLIEARRNLWRKRIENFLVKS